MSVTQQITQLVHHLPPERQAEVLDFVEFMISRQASRTFTVEARQQIVAKTLGCLADTHTSSDAFAQRKPYEKTQEERRWQRDHPPTV